MIRTEISARGVFINTLLEEIVASKCATLEGRLGQLEVASPLQVRLHWEAGRCSCRLTLQVATIGGLSAGGDHAAADIAVDRAFSALFRQVERVKGHHLARRRTALAA